MASESVQNPPATESKSSRKKKAKTEAANAGSPAAQAPTPKVESERGQSPNPEAKASGEFGYENPYIKELQKQIRNVNKKLNSMSKVDAIVAENPSLTLDELVKAKKINTDQKAQAQKKPALQAQLAQLEEQVAQYKKIDADHHSLFKAEKDKLVSSHQAELEKLRGDLAAEAAAKANTELKERLLTLSRFLRTAAARRQLNDDQSDEALAFEGALLLVYGGDSAAVAAAEKIIQGTEEGVPSTEGQVLDVTCKSTNAQIKRLALEEFGDESSGYEEDPATETIGTDPTVANAALTEIEDATTVIPNGTHEEALAAETSPVLEQTRTAIEGNAAAEETWNGDRVTGSDDPLAESYLMVSRDSTDTEPSNPTVAAPAQTLAWADDSPDQQQQFQPASGDGFHEVHHGRGGRGRGGAGGERRGGHRGRGDGRGRGGYRGRGEFRGRGRGEHRGGRGRGD
ncbi:hypothetical protein P152DRAFT_399946 [Eremomyces bilateralis CBS 781.70]|uniref:YAG7-like dimerisation domain-containing protein n=1 Tax=Eremomyces bilateralis CBS 781.70 TaxID=1392243 RepID=A0A6G1G005_9PEZI|nr:uncharacterized protein P152DRAFT_399946 [Eremomyces bilateralis CBS 781.70]KAF1811149.1 hypothetical protein P152DRAFT_399946 [Eremomyces bilateralis CBS 781.70]